MGLRSGLTLVTIGAILAFAVQVDFAGLDVQIVGYILMAAGLIAMTFAMRTRRRSTDDDIHDHQWPTGEPVVHDNDIDT
ncbi:MAG: DUF6458 family protein [Egibacteraceae bacterium]